MFCALVLFTSGYAQTAAPELQAYLDSLAAENRLSGAILIAKDGNAGRLAGDRLAVFRDQDRAGKPV
ncbi:MAG TPA: hypothetical protein VG095_09375, partial [Chthoniobacterales bacterium]|nr:hypothetical protein [Chthoniobacterales bacterium]